MGDQPGENDNPVLELQPGPPDTDTIELRVTPGYADELDQQLKDHGLHPHRVFEFSLGSDLAVLGLTIVGTGSLPRLITAISQALTAVFHRHDARNWTVKVGDAEYSVTGVSPKQAEAWIATVRQEQAELNQRWAETRRSIGQPDSQVEEESDS